MYRIIIADDEIIVRESLRDSINWNAYGISLVGAARDGQEAFDLISELKPDIAIIDIRMPYLDGIELIRKLNDEHTRTKFIVISGYSEFTYAQRAISLGVASYLVKPFDENELIEVVEDCIASIESNERLNDERKLIIQESENSKTRLNSYLLQEYVTGATELNGNVLEQFTSLGINKGNLSYSICILKYRNNPMALTDVLYNMKGFSGQESIHYLFSKLPDLHTLLFACSQSSKVKARDIFRNVGTRCLSMLFAAEEEPALYFGSICDNIISLPSSYTNAAIVQNFGSICSLGSITDYSMLVEERNKKAVKLMNEQHICNFVRTGDHQALSDALDNFVWHFFHEEDSYDTFKLKLFVIKVLNCIYNIPNSGGYTERDKAINEISRYDDIGKIYHAMKSHLMRLLEEMQQTNRKQTNRAIDIALNYIDMHYGEDITLESLSGMVYLNSSYFSELFSEAVGEPFSRYLIKYRINKAREMLENPAVRVSDVAEKVGYKDVSYFVKIFRKMEGITPALYKEKFR